MRVDLEMILEVRSWPRPLTDEQREVEQAITAELMKQAADTLEEAEAHLACAQRTIATLRRASAVAFFAGVAIGLLVGWML